MFEQKKKNLKKPQQRVLVSSLREFETHDLLTKELEKIVRRSLTIE